MRSLARILTHVPLLALLSLVAFATRLPTVGLSFVNVDEAAHMVGSQELFGAGRLYETFADNKPPLIYFFYALGAGSMVALRLLGIGLLWVPLGWLASREGASEPERKMAGCLYLLSSAGFVAADTHALNTEVLGLVPIAAATWLFFRSQVGTSLFAVGFLVGLAGLAKQPFLALLLAPLGALALPWPGFFAYARRLGPLLAGVACPLGIASSTFLALGNHDQYLRWVWLFNLQHVNPPLSASDVLARFAKMVLPLLAASGALFVLAFGPQFKRIVSEDRDSPLTSEPRRQTFLLIAFGLSLFTGCLGFRFFGHYFLPAHYFLVLLAARPFANALARPGRARWVAFLALAPGVAFSILNPFLYSPRIGIAPVTKPVFEQVGRFIARSVCEGPIFVWGYAPQVYYFAHRRPATRYVVPIEPVTEFISGNERFERGPLPPRFHVSEAARTELLQDLARSRPSHIVDFSSTRLDHWDRFPLSTFPGLSKFVSENYHNLGRPEGSVTIYENLACDR